MEHLSAKEIISKNIKVPTPIILSVIIFNILYLGWWLTFQNVGNIYLYLLLLVGEIFHVWQAIGFAITIRNQNAPVKPILSNPFTPDVDIFVTVCGEPIKIIKHTIESAKKINYPNFKIHILNDGYVAKKDNWEEVEQLASELGVNVITRKKPGGAKAGNINNALRKTKGPFIVVFDADHAPDEEFLNETIPYFTDKKLAILQTPQYYINRHDSFLIEAAWEQQELFFGPICRGKSNGNAMFWCGTNAVVRREALNEVGGVPEDNIAEDFLVSLRIHERGWNSLYVPKILAFGLGPFNLKDYITQQYRWARGSLEIMFRHNPIFSRKLTSIQKMHYLHSSSYYLNGLIVIIDALIPLVVLSTGVVPVVNDSGDFLLFFFPFMISTMYMLMVATNHTVTFKSLQLSVSLFYVHIQALVSILLNKKSSFKVTPKSETEGNFLMFAMPHMAYIVAATIVLSYSLLRFGLTPNFMNNAAWILFNASLFMGFIRPAYRWKTLFRLVLNSYTRLSIGINRKLIPVIVESTRSHKK